MSEMDMKYSYYPGCTLKNKAKDLDLYARRCAQVLGIELQELPEWQCCGAVYPMATDEIATKLSGVRALMDTRDLSTKGLVTLCSACHHVIKRINCDMQNQPQLQEKVQRYLQSEQPYRGETQVWHYLELLRDHIGFDELKKKVTNPLKGRKIAAYYGCMLLRPSKELNFDNPENPTIMESFIRAIGAEPVVYPYRNECCGGYVAMEKKSAAQRKCARIMASAMEGNADTIITACPLCMYNLCENSPQEKIPVAYFTELLAEALGVKEETTDA